MSDWRTIRDEREKYRAYLCSREWALLRNAVRERCGGICERCNDQEMDCVHHLTYARKYRERIEDLAGWCNQCHDFTHGKSDFDPLEVARNKRSYEQLTELIDRMGQQGFSYAEMCGALDALYESASGNPASAWGNAVVSVGGLVADFAEAPRSVRWHLGVLEVSVQHATACAFLNRREVLSAIKKHLASALGRPVEVKIDY